MVVGVARVGTPMHGDGGGPKDIDQGRILNCASTTNMAGGVRPPTGDYMTATNLGLGRQGPEAEVGIGIFSQHIRIRECKCGKAFQTGPN